MAKRPAEDGSEPSQKRQKVTDNNASAVEDIKTARQLQQILTFQQDAGPQLAKAIKQFKLFLESIVYATDKTTTQPQQTILKEYLESQTPKHGTDNEAPFLADLMQTWGFAAQANNETLQSATSSVLALLLKTMSTLIDFRDLGIQLCKTLLQQTQLKLISRALSAPRHKEHVISPCLRLLTEIVSFDGGAMARNVFAAKTFTFDGKILGRNLSLWKPAAENVEETRRRPSVRSNALRYIMANFKFQSSSAKSDILKYGNLLRPLFDHLKDDPSDHLQDTLDTIKTHVLLDEAIPRTSKNYLLNDHNLSNFASIYRQEQSSNSDTPDQLNPAKLVHAFLHFVCTSPSAGILRTPTGWYPPGTDKKQSDPEEENDLPEIDLGLASIEWYDRYHKHVPVRNGTLSAFAQTLRPYSNTQECELLIDILRSAPELVADYFFKKTGFAFDPKLTATWIGYSSFLFSTVRLPVPAYCGRKEGFYGIPPPISIVIESILPQPLNQKVLTRCLNQQIDLITFFALRLLVVAFEKLQKVLASFKEAAEEQGELWNEAAARLVTAFTHRCPKMKDAIGTFRRTPPENSIQREASLRVLLLYYEVIPQVAFDEKLDISVALADAMAAFEERPSAAHVADDATNPSQFPENLQLLELSHLLQIARWTPDTRWWNKPEGMKLSPFTTLLKVVSSTQHQKIPKSMQTLLSSIINEHGILHKTHHESSLSALIASITPQEEFSPSEALFRFLDDAFARLTRKPIKYQDDLDQIMANRNSKPVSLLLMTLAEQWPFASKASDSVNIGEWLGRLMQCLNRAGEDGEVLDIISAGMSRDANTKQQQKALTRRDNQNLESVFDNLLRRELNSTPTHSNEPTTLHPPTFTTIDPSSLAPPAEDPKHPGLHRWSTTDPQTAITSGHLGPLILCLSSADPSVRRLAFTHLATLMSRLLPLASSFPDSPQFYLLLGILTTTARPYIAADTAVPHLCTVYAAMASDILLEPLHPLYDKICRFHTRAPKWDVERLPSYWTHQILYTPSADTHSMPLPTTSSQTPTSTKTPTAASLTFLLTYLHASLRTPADLEILRKRNTLEPVLAATANPFLPKGCLDLVLKMLWRATCIEGGSDVLITRKGLVAWLGARIAAGKKQGKQEAEGNVLTSPNGYKQLLKRLWETCDRSRVDAWGNGMLEGLVAQLTSA